MTTTLVHRVNYVIDLRNCRQVGKEASSVAERKELVEKGNTFSQLGDWRVLDEAEEVQMRWCSTAKRVAALRELTPNLL